MPGSEQLLPARGQARLLIAALLLPVISAYAIMARFALNAPFIDDYASILGFAVRYHAMGGPLARLHFILADQYAEYKPVFSDALTALQVELIHHVSFTFDLWLGQLALLGLLAIFWQSYFAAERNLVRRLMLFAPIVFLLFGLNFGEALDWVSCSVGYLDTILLALLALHLLASPALAVRYWAFACAWISALVACSIAANAFLLLPLGLFVLLARRSFVRAALWPLLFLLALVPYFVHYTVEPHTGTGSALLIPVFFLNFIGAASPMQRFALLLGTLLLVLWFVALRTGFYRTHPSAMLGATWLLGSAAMASIGRGRTGLAFSLVSRYQIYSNLLLIFGYGYLAHRIVTGGLRESTRRRLLAASLCASLLFCIRGDVVGYRILDTRQQMLLRAFAAYHADPAHISPMHFGEPAADTYFKAYEIRAREITNAAVAQGLYTPPR